MLAIVSAPDVPPDPFLLELFELMMRHFRSEAIVPAMRDEQIKALKAPTCLLMGQGAGTAAALAAREGKQPRELDPDGIQLQLKEQGVNLE